MTTMKTLMLAGLAVMSLGARNAMADGSGIALPDYWAQQYRAAAKQAAANEVHIAVPGVSGVVQSGASDLDRSSPAFHYDTNLTEGGGG